MIACTATSSTSRLCSPPHLADDDLNCDRSVSPLFSFFFLFSKCFLSIFVNFHFSFMFLFFVKKFIFNEKKTGWLLSPLQKKKKDIKCILVQQTSDLCFLFSYFTFTYISRLTYDITSENRCRPGH
jgi:Serpentine type 7TM GPCR chemoreceptor Srt